MAVAGDRRGVGHLAEEKRLFAVQRLHQQARARFLSVFAQAGNLSMNIEYSYEEIKYSISRVDDDYYFNFKTEDTHRSELSSPVDELEFADALSDFAQFLRNKNAKFEKRDEKHDEHLFNYIQNFVNSAINETKINSYPWFRI